MNPPRLIAAYVGPASGLAAYLRSLAAHLAQKELVK